MRTRYLPLKLRITKVDVYAKPNIVLFCSGDEITKIQTVKIKYYCNVRIFWIIQHQYHFNFVYLGIVKDNPKDLKKYTTKYQKLEETQFL